MKLTRKGEEAIRAINLRHSELKAKYHDAWGRVCAEFSHYPPDLLTVAFGGIDRNSVDVGKLRLQRFIE